ncbi:MAG TPA: hypothetical protein VF823_06740 [Anaerolineales bacterium]
MKRQKQGWRYGALVLGLAVLALLVMDFNSRMAEIRRLADEQAIVQGQVTNQVQTKAYLETQIVYATSEGAVARWAYEDNHMVRPGDNPVIPVSSGGNTPTPTPTPMVTPVKVSNLQAWWELFLGSRTP